MTGIPSRVTRSYPTAQHAFDVALTLMLLPPVVLLGALIALAILLDSPGPVFFRSGRIGQGGVPFDMLKFRTMRHLAPGPRLTQRGDERQTPLGRYLAVSHLDELPQLWNVLRGEMRLVGPRPEVEEFVSDQRESYERILRVPPGLTGPTQLASADEGALLASAADREVLYRETILPGKVQLDLAYVASNSLRGDLAIVAKTCLLPVVRAGYWLGALAGADRAGRVVAAKVLLSVLLAVLVLGVFTVQASAG